MLNSGVKVLESTAGVIVMPFQRAGTYIVNGISGGVKSVFKSGEIRKENEKLKAEVDSLKAQAQLDAEIKKENERLKGLLGYAEKYPDYQMVPARVTAFSPDNWSVIIVIDKGSKHGIAENMPVVAQGGVVGRVLSVSDTWSKVITIVDSRTSMSAMVERSRDTGMIQGVGNANDKSGVCHMVNMPFSPSIMPGDNIITSEMGDGFPKGLLIGRVSEVAQGRNDRDEYAVVVPSVDFAHLENVLVMKKAES
jgi:rod shape-determining protein MreC